MGKALTQEDLVPLEMATAFNYEARFNLPGGERQHLQGPNFDWNKWLPVQDIDPPIGSIRTRNLDFVAGFVIPDGIEVSQITANFLDSSEFHIKKFIEHWFNRVVVDNRKMTVGCLFDISRELQIRKFAELGRQVDYDSYYVFPMGSANQALASASNDLFVLPVTFAVVGDSLGGE